MKKEKQSWTDYVPHSVSLYYVDYRENLDSLDDLQGYHGERQLAPLWCGE